MRDEEGKRKSSKGNGHNKYVVERRERRRRGSWVENWERRQVGTKGNKTIDVVSECTLIYICLPASATKAIIMQYKSSRSEEAVYGDALFIEFQRQVTMHQ